MKFEIKKNIKDFSSNIFRMLFTKCSYKNSYINRLEFDKYIISISKKQFETKHRLDKISAVIRVKNGAEYIESSILSILPLVSEIIIVDNNSSDETYKISQRLSKELGEVCSIKVFKYERKLEVAGVGYNIRLKSNPAGSLADFYNYCFSLASCDYVLKWDAHGIMFEKGIDLIQKYLLDKPDAISFRGVEFYGKNLDSEMRIYKKTLPLSYVDDDFYERLDFSKIEYNTLLNKIIRVPVYLHLKRLSYNRINFNEIKENNPIEFKYK